MILIAALILWLIGVPKQDLRAQERTEETTHRHNQEQGSGRSDKDKDRWMWQLPEQVLDSIGVSEGMVVADVGAGDGYFTFRLARRVGALGKVYANEIDESCLVEIRERANLEGISNIVTVLGDPHTPNLPDTLIDVVLLVNVIHLVSDQPLFLQNIRKCMKPDGILAIVQWESGKLAAEVPKSEPVPDLKEFDHSALLETIEAAGFSVDHQFTFLPLQNILMCYSRVED
jgi:ubiquinone/menaquinone biosynthesis C-methylase UbiE